ncbi:MAG TPA: TRAP transporter large permease subunit [Syntrophomonadaceae bacterium]|nr:TRAP transporter large permease subunit [Syntrophomonadaceae bacterium]
MSPELLTVLMFVGVLVGVFLGFPIAFTLAGLGITFGLIGWGDQVFALMGSRAFGVMANYTYVAIPLFIFMGAMLERSGVADIAFAVLNQWMKNVKGSLAYATIIISTMFAACTGVVGASVTTMGLLALPPMNDRGYDKKLSTGVVAAGGTLGILIPPSIMLVLFGPMANLSVVDLFAAAIIPGLLLAFLYLVYTFLLIKFKKGVVPDQALHEGEEIYTIWDGIKAFVPFIAVIFAVMGAILFGIAAPTEAAALGAFGATVIALAFRKLNWRVIKESAMSTLKITTMVAFVAVGANIFTAVFFGVGGGAVVSNFVSALGLGPTGTMMMVLLIVLLLGMLIDWIGILLIIVPIFMPIIVQFGIDPLWAAMLICIILQTSFLTPPFAYTLFYIRGIAPPGINIGHIYAGVIPFIGLQLLGLALCYFFPKIITVLPAALAAAR